MKLHILIGTLHIDDGNLILCQVFVNNSITHKITQRSKFNILTMVAYVEMTVYAILVTNCIV
jgi:hypothetical protein